MKHNFASVFSGKMTVKVIKVHLISSDSAFIYNICTFCLYRSRPMHTLFSFVQRLAYECLSQSIDSAKHSPNLVPTATKPDTVQTESMSYGQYLGMIKSQITCAKDIHNALLECSKKIAGKVQPPGIM